MSCLLLLLLQQIRQISDVVTSTPLYHQQLHSHHPMQAETDTEKTPMHPPKKEEKT
jgi:hypothetical protein